MSLLERLAHLANHDKWLCNIWNLTSSQTSSKPGVKSPWNNHIIRVEWWVVRGAAILERYMEKWEEGPRGRKSKGYIYLTPWVRDCRVKRVALTSTRVSLCFIHLLPPTWFDCQKQEPLTYSLGHGWLEMKLVKYINVTRVPTQNSRQL